jgi:uncharacterized DUF497 family protein
LNVALSFEWDLQKAAGNLAKHRVSFEEASSVFGDPLARIVGDLRHSGDEERWVILGLSNLHRLLAVMFTERGNAIRIISARRATSRERKSYEKESNET